MTKKDLTSVYTSLQEAIHSGKLKMRSKKYFIAINILLGVSIIIITLALVYLISFVFFILHINGMWELSGFGFRGLFPFLISIPWFLVIITLLFIISLEFLVKKTTIVYRKPLVYSVVGLVSLVSLAGFTFAQLPLHENLYHRSFGDDASSLVGGFYKEFGQRPLHNAYPGTILEINQNGFSMRTGMNMNENINVVVTGDTVLIDQRELEINDNVMVIGERNDNTIIAEAIKLRDGYRMRSFNMPPGPSGMPSSKPMMRP